MKKNYHNQYVGLNACIITAQKPIVSSFQNINLPSTFEITLFIMIKEKQEPFHYTVKATIGNYNEQNQ